MPQRQAYHVTRSLASSTVCTAMVVNHSHALGLHPVWGLDCTDLDGPQRHGGHALRLAMLGWPQGQGAKSQGQRGVTPWLGAAPGPLPAEGLHYRLRLHGGPHIALGCLHTNGPTTPGRPPVVNIGFPVTKAAKAALGTPVLGTTHRRQTGAPFLAFLLADGQLLAPDALAHVGGVTGPHLLGQQPQGERSGVNASVLERFGGGRDWLGGGRPETALRSRGGRAPATSARRRRLPSRLSYSFQEKDLLARRT